MELLRPDALEPALDMALSEVLLREVATGERGATARVLRPAPTLAFGRRDALLPGFGAAEAAARAHGFVPVVRLGGGRAAAYDPGCVVVELVVPHDGGIGEGTEGRFVTAAGVLADALEAVGVTTEAGELPDEWCPGRWSLHVGGVKIAGVAQRSVRGAALTTGVVLVEASARRRAVLVEVYAALGLALDPATVGGAAELDAATVGRAAEPGALLSADAVEAAVVAVLGLRWGLEPGVIGEPTRRRVRSLLTKPG